MEQIKVQNLNNPEVDIVKFVGIIDNQIKEILTETIQSLRPRVILDFSQSERINSMGITVMLKSLKAHHARGGMICYVSLTRLNNKLFRMVGLTKLGKIFDNNDDALTYLSTQKK